MEADDSTNSFRDHVTGQISADENECYYGVWTLCDRTELNEATNNARMVYNNAGVPDIATVDINSLTNVPEAHIQFLSAMKKLIFKNNWQAPCVMDCHYYFCKDNTDNHARSFFTSDLDDKSVTNPTTDLRYSVVDARKDLPRYWRQYKHRRYILFAGQEVTISLNRRKPFSYMVSASPEYMKGYAQCLMIRIHGTVAHDAQETGDVGIQPVTLDYYELLSYRYHADLNRKFKFSHLGTGTLPASTSGFVASSMEQEHVNHEG